MSESKVPLPEPFSKGLACFSRIQLKTYGDARAAEAWWLALLEVIKLVENASDYTRADLIDLLRFKLRALADERQPSAT